MKVLHNKYLIIKAPDLKTNDQIRKSKFIAVIGPKAPPYGGMANQARLLIQSLEKDNHKTVFIPTNQSLPQLEKVIDKFFGLRTIVRAFVYYYRLLLAAVKCDVFHIMACSHWYFFINVIPAVLIGFAFQKRVVVNYRGGEAESFFNNRGKGFTWLLNIANSIVVPSMFLKHVFQSLKVKSVVIPNIISLKRFKFKQPEICENGAVNFICTRQFELYYDIPTLIHGFSSVKKKNIHSKLILIGEGTQYQLIKTLVKDLDLEDSVDFMGKVPAEDIPLYLNKADIFVNSSIVDNYPNSLLEAFAAGLPVITTSAGGIPYLVNHFKNGILVEPSNPDSLADAMITLANDSDVCRQLALEGYQTAIMHSWEEIWPLLRREYFKE
jgi:glycosyltransferase involved in cell wall biosynthesis